MAKRFIDTDLFKKPGFKDLKAPYKLLWVYILCECNHVGIWNVEMDVAGLRIGQKIPEDCASTMSKMVQVIDGGRKWWIRDFVRFQYGPELVTANRMHASVIRELELWGLMDSLEDVSVVGQGTSVNAVRQRLSKKMRADVLMRDELTCQYCQTQRPTAELVVDHIHPVIKGGGNEDDNLAACCVRCNGHKTDLDLSDFVSRGHSFLNPTERIINKLNGAFKPLLGAKDKEKDKEQDNSSGKERAGGKVIPLPFTTEAFALAWARWELHRKQKKNPITPETRTSQLSKCLEWGELRAIAAINNSIEKGWVGLFEPEGKGASKNPATAIPLGARDIGTDWTVLDNPKTA